MISWKDAFIIVVGSWDMHFNRNSAELYNIAQDSWSLLPKLNYETWSPGLIIIEDRYLYKVGGSTNVRIIERLDLLKINQKWITIKTSN